MALAVIHARGMVSDDVWSRVFDPTRHYDIPAAPARGLLLDRPEFAAYDALCRKHGYTTLSDAYDRNREKINEFKRVLEQEICDAQPSHAAYRQMLLALQGQAKKHHRQKQTMQQQQKPKVNVTTSG